MAEVKGPGGESVDKLRRAEQAAWHKYKANPNSHTKRAYEDASRLLRAALIRSRRS